MSEITKDVPEIFRYERPALPEDCLFAISPSSIGKFFNYPKVWYNECYEGLPSDFKGNTATVTGTICHWIYEQLTKDKNVQLDREIINQQLDEYLTVCPNPDVDVKQVKIDYPLVSSAVVNGYLLEANSKGMLVKSEEQVVGKVIDKVYVAGTCDRIEGDCVVDFKTVATKPNDTVIPFDYKIQLLAYAYALRQKGYEINRIRLVYGVKPTIRLPARCIVVTEQIDFMAEKLVDDTLKLIAETVCYVKDNPNMAYLLFKSMDLKK